MERKNILSITKRVILYIRWSISGILLILLIVGMIGFVMKWIGLIAHPESVLTDFKSVTQDVFSILLVYELFDLLRTLSPNRLMDVVLLVIARKIVLLPDQSNLLMEVGAFAILLMVRLLWQRFHRVSHDSDI